MEVQRLRLAGGVAAVLLLAAGCMVSERAPRREIVPALGQPVAARVLMGDTAEVVDAAAEITAATAPFVRVDDAGSSVLAGEVLLPSPGASLVVDVGGQEGQKGPAASFGMSLSADGAVQFSGAAKGTADLKLPGKPEETWIAFSVLRAGGMAFVRVGGALLPSAVVPRESRRVHLALRGQARLRRLTASPLALADKLLVPVALDRMPQVALSGAGVDLGGELALAEEGIPEGPMMLDGVLFLLNGKGVDVSASLKGLKEPLRLKQGLRGGLVTGVPTDQYAALHLLAFSRELGGAVPRLTLRFGHQFVFNEANTRVEVPDIRAGRGGAGVVSRVAVPLADGTEGFIYHLRVPVANTANIAWEMKAAGMGMMDMEFARDVNVHVNLPDPYEFGYVPAGPPSSAVVLGAALERSPVEVFYTTGEAGNIFYDTQQAAFRVKVVSRSQGPLTGEARARCWGPGTSEEGRRRSDWTVSVPYELQPGEATELTLDVTPERKKRGWYECTVEVTAGNSVAQSRRTSFAVLAPDTRQARDDSPFGTWVWIGRTHAIFAPPDISERQGSIVRKGGWRWSMIDGSAQHLLKATAVSLPRSYQNMLGWYDEATFQKEVVPAIQQSRQSGAEAVYKVMHESRSSGELLLRFSEFLGGKPYDMPPEEKANIDGQFENVVKYCRAVKAADAEGKIVLINDYPGVGIEFMKRGMPKDAFDIFGSEGANFMREPERQPDWLCLLGQCAIWNRARKTYGYEDKPVWFTEALYHGTNPGNLTLHKQAVIYVREAMLALANGVERMVGQGGPRDYTSDYRSSNWGCVGFCGRDPELAAKPSFAMFAWLTQALDQASFAGFIRSDSTSLHVLDFVKPDASHVYPVWVVRGRQKVTLRARGDAPVVYDNYGNVVRAPFEDGRLTFEVGDAPFYVTGAVVESVFAREPVEVAQAGGALLLDFDDRAALRVVPERSDVLEGNWDYPRLKGNFRTDFVLEDGVTALRVQLLRDDDERKLLQRYVELALREPVLMKWPVWAITARVKGNGGWGRIMFELVDAKGRVFTSCGNQNPGAANSSDPKGDSYVSFDGWQTMVIPLPGQYPGHDQFVIWPHNYNWWPTNTAEGDTPGTGLAGVDYPLRLTKVIVAMPPHILYVNEERAVLEPVIFIDQLGFSGASERTGRY